MYLLNTDVVSELRRIKPHGAVVEWVGGIAESDLHLSVVTLGEIQAGIEVTKRTDSAKAVELEHWLEQVAATYNVIAMDGRAFRQWARLMHGRTDNLIEDAMIAATALCHDLIVVTRNIRDFVPFGTRTLNPFSKRKL